MVKMNNENKGSRLFLIVAGVVAAVALLAIVVIVLYNAPSKRFQRQMDIGDRYLEDLNYEQAIVAFEAALRIDPKNEEVLRKMAEAYLAWAAEEESLGNSERALQILENGYQATKSENIEQRMASLDASPSESQEIQGKGDDITDQGTVRYRLKKVTCYQEDELISWDEYEYDEKGRKARIMSYLPSGETDGWTELEYDDSGNEVKRILYSNTGTINQVIEFEYDDQGREIKFLSYYRDNLVSAIQYEYDDLGRKKSANSSGDLIKYEYEYDKLGNMIRSTAHYDNPEDWIEYEYDELGNMIRKTSYGQNTENHFGAGMDCEYDDYGNIIKEVYRFGNGEIYNGDIQTIRTYVNEYEEVKEE